MPLQSMLSTMRCWAVCRKGELRRLGRRMGKHEGSWLASGSCGCVVHAWRWVGLCVLTHGVHTCVCRRRVELYPCSLLCDGTGGVPLARMRHGITLLRYTCFDR